MFLQVGCLLCSLTNNVKALDLSECIKCAQIIYFRASLSLSVKRNVRLICQLIFVVHMGYGDACLPGTFHELNARHC